MPNRSNNNARPVFRSGKQDGFLARLYGSRAGRLLLKLLVSPVVSKAAGAFLSTRLSTVLIKPFIKSNGIDMTEYEDVRYRSYNEFFSRTIRPERRPIDMEPTHFVSPCDSKLTVLPITADSVFTLKHTPYTVESLLRSAALAEKYRGGYALIFRLTVDDYHRYCYVADGTKGENVHIPGVLHTVNPIANDYFPIYKENTREYSILHTEVFGDVLMMEVGALLVGRIVNHHQAANIQRGQEKGYFQFGGSTVVLLVEKDRIQIDEEIILNSNAQLESIVKMGESIGRVL